MHIHFRELSAIQSELVEKRSQYVILIPLIEILVNHNHYAWKTGIGHDRIVERVHEKVRELELIWSTKWRWISILITSPIISYSNSVLFLW